MPRKTVTVQPADNGFVVETTIDSGSFDTPDERMTHVALTEAEASKAVTKALGLDKKAKGHALPHTELT